MIRHSKKLTAGLGVVTAGLLSTGVAYAAWTSTGTGTGSAASGTSANSAIVAVTPSATLFPGATQSVQVTISNPNPYPIEVTSITPGFSAAIDNCIAATVRSTAPAATANGALPQADGTTTVIAPKVGDTNGSGTYTLQVKMSNLAHNDCKSQSFVLGASATTGAGDLTAQIRSAATANGF